MRRLVPTAGELVDAVVVLGLGLLALLGFGTTFEGYRYLVVGGVALGIGILLAHLTTVARLPMAALLVFTVVVFFLTAPPLVLPDDPWFSLPTLLTLASSASLSWKELLTTTPPIEAASPLLVIPYQLGLLAGAVGFGAAQRLARRSRTGTVLALVRAATPVAAPLAMLVVVLACGTDEPAAAVLDGVVFALVALVWTSARLRRLRPPARNATRPARRAASAGAVLAVATAAAIFGAPLLPGAGTDRTVLRDYILPPFDLSQYPSPLVGFRKYTKDANNLYDQVLFTVDGLSEGDRVRIATLDDYDGTVWGATHEDSFRLVSQRITTEPVGPLTTVTVTVGDAYGAATDLRSWVPGVGTVARVDFTGDRARDLSGSLHYSRDLSAGIVTTPLRGGDTYVLQTALTTPTLPDDLAPFGTPVLTDGAQALLSSKISTWTSAANAPLRERLTAVAEWLKTNGAFTHGGPGEERYLPGHGTGRLDSFLKEQTPAGDDEQYAALYALAANYLGVPARVVFGATVPADGIVRGADVHAWVELHLADGSWVPVLEKDFMPDESKKPQQEPPQDFVNQETPVVPPPNAGRLPTTSTDTSRVDPFPQTVTDPPWWRVALAIVIAVATWLGPPVLMGLIVIWTILGLKRRRRNRRRRLPVVANRYAGAFMELVDGVRDLAQVRPELRDDRVTFGSTRKEHAAVLDTLGLLPPGTFSQLAARVDTVVYGFDDPTVTPAQRAKQAKQFWVEVDKLRRQLTAGVRGGRRWRVRLSLRSLRIADPTRAAPPQALPTAPRPALATGTTA